MLKKLIPAAVALCLLALSLGTAAAHEPRDIEDYNLVVGFLNEPAFEGMLNGVSLRVTKVAEHAHSHAHGEAHSAATPVEKKEDTSSSGGQAAMGHGAMSHGPMESEVPVTIHLMTDVDDSGGVNVRIMTDGWRWSPESVNREPSPGEGHAHIYVDGVKLNRIYGSNYYLEGLEPGERHVRVSLNTNDHNELTIGGELLEATAMVTIPEGDGDKMMGMPHESPVDAPGMMSLEVMAHSDPLGGYNLQVMPHGFTFAPQNIDGEHVPGEGYGIVSINGEVHARLYTEWLKLPALDTGVHDIEVRLISNNHMPYRSHSEPVTASAMVNVVESSDSSGTDHHAKPMESQTSDQEMADAAAEGAAGGHSEALIIGVVGLEKTLLVEVTHVPSGATRFMSLQAVFEEPGHYKADFIPTASGQYVFHFTGVIEDLQVDERFESGVGTFEDVEPANSIQFPESAASTRELESAVRGALESAQHAQDTALAVEAATTNVQSSASTAVTLAIAGIVVGAVGIVVGGVGMVAVFRRRS